MTPSFWTRAANYPPILVRMLARHKNGAVLTDKEISERGGLQPCMVIGISDNTSWDGIDVVTMEKFLKGCGVDFCDRAAMKRIYNWGCEQVRLEKLGRSNWRHLKRSKEWKTIYQPMMVRYQRSLSR